MSMYDRYAGDKIRDALSDTRVVLVSGPRQSGKTTLATDIAADNMPFLALDDATALAAARDDPVGFIRGWSVRRSTRCSAHLTYSSQSRGRWTATRRAIRGSGVRAT